MPLINCPDCGKPVSTEAKACPACGYPVAEKMAASPATAAAAIPVTAADPNELLAEVRPSWWNYFWHLFFFFLIVPPIIAAVKRASITLRIYPSRISLERGWFKKCYRDFVPRDIRAIDIDQGIIARMVGIGDVTISTAASADATEKIEGIPDPIGVKELILKQRGSQ